MSFSALPTKAPCPCLVEIPGPAHIEFPSNVSRQGRFHAAFSCFALIPRLKAASRLGKLRAMRSSSEKFCTPVLLAFGPGPRQSPRRAPIGTGAMAIKRSSSRISCSPPGPWYVTCTEPGPVQRHVSHGQSGNKPPDGHPYPVETTRPSKNYMVNGSRFPSTCPYLSSLHYSKYLYRQ